jgi:hypothetical protein
MKSNTLQDRLIAFLSNDTWMYILVCVVLAVLQVLFGLDHFYYDAERYWESARMFISQGTFSIYTFEEARGLLFPLFNYGLIKLAEVLSLNEIGLFKSVNVLFVCWGFWYVLPGIYEKAAGIRVHTGSKLVLLCLGQFFWFRSFSVPLTDFMCLFLLLYIFLLLWNDKPACGYVILAGLLCGYVFNTRPIYNMLMVVCPLFLLLVNKQGWVIRGLKVIVFVAASVLISVPQYMLNKERYKTTTIFQPTEAFYHGQSLYLLQLKWGVYIQKYETYVGERECYKSAQVFFFRDAQHEQRKAETEDIHTFGEYAGYVISHPSLLLKYPKNLFNGLDIQYNSVYITDMHTSLAFAIVNYAVFFAGILLVILCRKRIFATTGSRIIFGCLAFFIALSIPIATEVRFMVSIHFFMYLVVAAEWKTGLEFWRNGTITRKGIIAVALIAWILACVCLSASTYANLQLPVEC